ncbi:MAG: hypothetical protein KF886_12750 [Candidatus Hydrogenedentes bacterium]|nr:hypothetical protein [Candidatus Hydrogenedentota bacterium]
MIRRILENNKSRYVTLCIFLSLAMPAMCQEVREKLIDQLVGYEFPRLADLAGTYPEQTESEIGLFRVDLRHQFMSMANSEVSTETINRLEAYLDVRDRWLQEESVVRCVLAGMITMAIDELLIEFAKKVSEVDNSFSQALSGVSSRNNLTGRGLFQAVDRTLGEFGADYKPFMSFCKDRPVMPQEACWSSYIQQFGLSYRRVSLGNNSVRFMDTPGGAPEISLARVGLYEEVSGNAVFVLHVKDPVYIIQFMTRVLDYNRLRRFVWREQFEQFVNDQKYRGIGEVAKALEELGPAGERWLAIESYSSNHDVYLDLLSHMVNPGMRESLLASVSERDAEKYRKLMRLAEELKSH